MCASFSPPWLLPSFPSPLTPLGQSTPHSHPGRHTAATSPHTHTATLSLIMAQDRDQESKLDARLGSLLSARKTQGRFRSLKEYDTSPSSRLTDFVSDSQVCECGPRSPDLLISWGEHMGKMEALGLVRARTSPMMARSSAAIAKRSFPHLCFCDMPPSNSSPDTHPNASRRTTT
jgi:hypothetical protein